MAVAFRSASGGTDLATALPAGNAQDDVLFAQVTTETNGTTPTAATGWTLIDGFTSNNEPARGLSCHWYWIARGVSAPATNWSTGGAASPQVSYLCYSGAHTTSPVSDWVTNTTAVPGGDTTWECLTFTNNTDQSMQIAMGGLNEWQTSTADLTNERLDGASTMSAHFYDHGLIGIGSVAQRVITGARGWAVIHFALKPAAGATVAAPPIPILRPPSPFSGPQHFPLPPFVPGDVQPPPLGEVAQDSSTYSPAQYQYPPGRLSPASFLNRWQFVPGKLVATTLDLTVSSVLYVAVLAQSDGASPAPSAAALVEVGVHPRSEGASPAPSAASLVELGTFAQSAAQPAPSATSQVGVGVLGQSGGSLLEVSKSSQLLVGVHARSDGASPAPAAVSLVEVGVHPRSGAARPEPSAVSQVVVGVLGQSGGSLLEVSKSSQLLVGVHVRSQPQAVTDVTVTALAVVGVLVTSQPIPAPSTASTVLLGVRGHTAPVVEPSAAGLALLGVHTRSGGATPAVSAAVSAVVGARLYGSPAVAVTASGLLVVGVQALSQPTLQLTIDGRVYVGVHAYGLITLPDGPLVYGPVIVWAEPGGLRFVEHAGLRWWEPSTVGAVEAGRLLVWRDPSTIGGQ